MSEETSYILGIDPGLKSMGYALIDAQGMPLDWGCVRPPSQELLSKRLSIIYQALDHFTQEHPISQIAVESQFVHQNAMSALKLGIAKGAALLFAANHNIPIFEYSPTKVKKTLCGHGRASKEEVQRMLSSEFGIELQALPSDAADALAIALCHRCMLRSPMRVAEPV